MPERRMTWLFAGGKKCKFILMAAHNIIISVQGVDQNFFCLLSLRTRNQDRFITDFPLPMVLRISYTFSCACLL